MNKISSLILMLLISSCSSIAFWQSDEVDPDEPRELEDFNERFEFTENWEIKFKGENNLNNFIPAFSGGSLFFFFLEGNVSNMDIESGDVLCSYRWVHHDLSLQSCRKLDLGELRHWEPEADGI